MLHSDYAIDCVCQYASLCKYVNKYTTVSTAVMLRELTSSSYLFDPPTSELVFIHPSIEANIVMNLGAYLG